MFSSTTHSTVAAADTRKPRINSKHFAIYDLFTNCKGNTQDTLHVNPQLNTQYNNTNNNNNTNYRKAIKAKSYRLQYYTAQSIS